MKPQRKSICVWAQVYVLAFCICESAKQGKALCVTKNKGILKKK